MKRPALSAAPSQPTHVDRFLMALLAHARKADRGSYAFMNANQQCIGFVQFITDSSRQLTIHRIWALNTGTGAGSFMLQTLCDLADACDVDLTLKVTPIGRKPYPLSRDDLFRWYTRHGFKGTRQKMIRKPATAIVASLKK